MTVSASSFGGRQARLVCVYVVVVVALVVGTLLLKSSTWQGSARLHTIMEVVATVIALFVGVLALLRFYSKKSNTYLFIGVGFFGTACLDGYHAIVNSALFNGRFPSLPESLIPWSWAPSRVFLSIVMFISWWVWRREERYGEHGRIKEPLVFAIVGIMMLASFAFFAFVPLGRALFPEYLFGRPQEFIAALFFLLAIVGYLHKDRWHVDPFENWVVISLFVGLIAQAVAMSRSHALFDAMFDLAHLLKIVSYVCVLIGLSTSIYANYLQLEERTAQLARANVELARRNKELNEFAYVASHDLKAPLRGIDNLATWIAEDCTALLPDKSKEHLCKMQVRVRRMESLLDDILEYSRAGRVLGDIATIDAGQIVREAIDLCEPRNGFRVTVADAMPILTTFHTPLKQVFSNLIDNAIKHHDRPDGKAEICAEEQADFFEFSIRDDGPGIDPEFHERVFQMFHTLRPRDEVEGSGVGLAVVKRVVENQGGAVRVESNGRGTMIRFTWPKTVSPA